MKLFFGLLLLTPVLAFAQDRQVLESRVQNALRDARQAVNQNIQYMDNRDLMRVEQLLHKVTEAAAGTVRPMPTPIPRPMPMMVCARDHVNTFQSTFNQIKNFAYNVGNRGTTASIDYATEWTNKHPCSLAPKFIADFTRIKTHAYNNMNMGTTASIGYAETMVARVCSNIQFEQIFNQYKNFAYNSMNMGTTASINYAQPKMEAEAFYCRNF